MIIWCGEKVMYLTVDKGSMRGGKSTALWMRYQEYQRQGKLRILVLKHELDTRYSLDHIVTRGNPGHRIPCKRVRDLGWIQTKDWDVIIIDEAQWFKDLEPWCRAHFHEDIRVHIAGLNGDRDQQCYGQVNLLSPMCSEEVVHYARCQICNEIAPFTIYMGTKLGRDIVGDDGYYTVCQKHVCLAQKDEPFQDHEYIGQGNLPEGPEAREGRMGGIDPVARHHDGDSRPCRSTCELWLCSGHQLPGAGQEACRQWSQEDHV